MLTSATKRKIDNARDILVGKIPMPTTQVEQITLALIYKFMSDIDKKSKALGDTSGFFANGYEKYAWDNLMDKSLSARDRVTLYSEGLEKLSKNPHIPQLFRDIFKNAFLPFRSPETLKLFLEQIDEFQYDHSEELGNAFEYLLSVMGSQGDAGQFRTPRHIIDFIVKVVDPSKTDTILDPACGTAGFLISAYKHIREKGLTAEEQKKLTDNFVGYDISHDMQRLAMVNMYLHHFPDPKIFEYDTLSSEDRWDDDFDVILANPPFMTPTGGIRPHSKFSIKTTRAEALFTSYIMEHLTNKGKAGVIVPEGIIFKTDSAYKSLRKMMVEDNYLWAVVSLPGGVFNPYAGVKTSILFFDREIARKTDKILFVKAESDGFDLGAQRREIKQNDLLLAKKLLLKFKQAILEGKELSKDDVIELGGSTSDKRMMSAYGFDLNAQNHIELSQIINKAYNEVSKKELQINEYNLNGDRYKASINTDNSQYEIVSLSDQQYFQIESGGTPKTKNESYWNGSIQWATLVDLPQSDLVSEIHKTVRTITDIGVKNSSAKVLPVDSVIVSTRATIGRIGINKIPLATNQGFKNIVIKDKNRVLPQYVAYMLTSRIEDMKQMATGGTFAELSKTNFSKLQIPLPPYSIQQEIVKEIETLEMENKKLEDQIRENKTKIKKKIKKTWSE